MRKNFIFLSLILSLVSVSSAFSQIKSSDLSFKIYGGYGFIAPSADRFFAEGDTHSQGSQNSTTAYSQTKQGFGNGPHFGAGVSLKLTKFLSVGIDADYLTGKKNAALNLPDDTLTGNFSAKYSVLSIIPNISFNLFTNRKYSIYNTIGVVGTIGTKVDLDHTTSQYVNSVTYSGDNSIDYKYGLNIGFKDAVGVQFNVAKNIDVFAELAGYFVSVKPTSATATDAYSASATGQYIAEIYNYQITYKNSGSFNYQSSSTGSGNTGVTNISYNDHPSAQHIYSVGLNAGVRISLGK